MNTCFLFPGQGAQHPGMGRDLWEASDSVKSLFRSASESTGKDLRRLLFDGTEEELRETENTQIAVTLVNIAAAAVLRERGIEADLCAGFSLGELAALHEAGVIGSDVVFAVVKKRGEIMADTANRLKTASGRPGMAAVLGLDLEEAGGVLKRLANTQVYLANHSSPTQIVLSGTAEGLDKAEPLFDEAGALRFVRLRVSGPFHSPLMAEAREQLKEYLRGVSFHDPVKPVYANVTGEAVESGEQARQLCIDQIVSTVLWVKTEESIMSAGPLKVLEVGPGTVLGGLWKSFNKKLKCRSAGTLSDIDGLTENGNTLL